MKTRIPVSLVSRCSSGALGAAAALLFATSLNAFAQVASLAFTTQPGSVVVGSPFGQQPVLQTVDVTGTPTTAGLPSVLMVNVSVLNGSGTLLGTTNVNLGTSGLNGIATFTDLEIDTPGTGEQLTATLASSASLLVPNPVLWLDAADLSTVTTNNPNPNTVSAWLNKGTGGAGVSDMNFTQADGTLQPTINYGALSGLPVLTFDGNTTYLANFSSSYANSGSQMTYFVVTKESDNTQQWRGPVSFSTGGAHDGWDTAGVTIIGDATQPAPYPISIQRHHQGTPLQAEIPPPNSGTPYVMTFLDNAGTASLYYTDQSGNSQASTANIVNGIDPYTYNITDVAIGGRFEPDPTIQHNWPGDIAEVLVYNTALSDSDRASVEGYLTNKWFNGLSISNTASMAFDVTTPGTLQSINLQLPANVSYGQSAQATVTANFTGKSFDITATAGYLSGNTAAATVSPSGLVIGAGLGSSLITASYDGMQSAKTINVVAAAPQSLTLTVASTVTAGNTLPSDVLANYQYFTNDVTTAPGVSYQSDNTGFFTVSGAGLVTGVSAGTANLIVHYGGAQTSQSIQVVAASTFPAVGLAFFQQPGAATAGSPFAQQPVLKTVDQFGNPTLVNLPAVQNVYLSLVSGSGALSGTTVQNIGTSGGNGTLNFADLAIDTAGGGFRIEAESTGLPGNQVPGAILWLDANDASTLSLNGSQVQGWKNKGLGGGATGTNLWFTQTKPTQQPVLNGGSMNGLPVVSFNDNGVGNAGGGDFLGNFQKSYTNGTSQMTYFLVTRQNNNGANWRGPVSFSTAGQIDGKGTAGVVILADGSGTAPYPLGIQRNHPTTPMQADVPVPAAGTPFVLTFLDDGGNAQLSYTDANGGTQANSDNIVNGISPYSYNITDVTIGGRLETDPGVDNHWPGDIAEVLVYNAALSTADRTAVQSYLTSKWLTPVTPGLNLSNTVSAAFNVLSSGGLPPSQKITRVAVGNGGAVSVTFDATPGATYTLQMTTDLAPAAWTDISGTTTNASGTVVTLTDGSTGPGVSHRFYRTVAR